MRGGARGWVRSFGVVTLRSIPKVKVEKRRVRLVVLLQIVHVLGKEGERGRRSDIVRILVSEHHKLVVER